MLADFFFSLFEVFFLFTLPLCQNVFNIHLTGNLLLDAFRLGHYQADLTVGFLCQYIRQLLGRFHRYGHFMHFVNLFDRAFRLTLCLHRHLRLCFWLHFCFRQFRHNILFLKRCRFLRQDLLGLYLRNLRQITDLSGLTKEHLGTFDLLGLRLQIILTDLCNLRIIQRFCIGIHHRCYDRTGNGVRCRFRGIFLGLLTEDFTKSRCKFCLQIDGIILTHIHGLHMNIEIILLRLCGGLLRRLLHGFIDLGISGYLVIVILLNIALILIVVSVLRIVLRMPLALVIVPILGIILSIILIIPLTLIIASVLGVTLIITLICAIPIVLHRVLRRDKASGCIEPMIVFFLLLRCQRLMEHFQFHRLNHIFSFAEPKDQFITFLYTSGCQSHSVIQICQFICPFFPVISLLQFFQN